MTQESTMICVDNSEWMRNGDLPPTRFNCQQEAVRALIHLKLRNNPENAVGLLSLADRIDVLNSLTTEDRKLIVRLHSLEILGVSKVFDGIKTAYLALKHRKNRNHRQRIVVFVGSPLDPLLAEKEMFMKFAKKLKKEKVSVDFVLFGEATAENNKIIADFVDILNGTEEGASHLLVVPVGDTKLYDALIRSPICAGAGAAVGAVGEFGINEEDDPELAMALRISLEEQRLRQQPQQGGEGTGQQQQNAPATMEIDQQQSNSAGQVAPGEGAQQSQQQEMPDLSAMTEEEQLEYVIRLSMTGNQPTQSAQDGQQNQQQSRSPSGAMSTPAPTPMEVEEGTAGNNAKGSTGGGVQLGDLLQHPEMLRQLVGQVPVDSNEATTKDQPKEVKESDEKKSTKKETERKDDKKGNSSEK
ncbi:hypothetical protein niasHS_002562 [Heterodera schachtii]|uniref:26S proteasome non-ATPase regulatory subunit 4 n=1 Tax=Heterodera schachtii TaxID=97005 RepID=A0ABD2KKJ0_HETSC